MLRAAGSVFRWMVFAAPALCGVIAPGCTTGNDARIDGGASAESGVVTVANDLRQAIQAALADAARRAPTGAAAPTLVRADRVTWADGSLGCPAPGRVYTMALVPGYRILIRSGSADLDYHASERGLPFLCPPGRATDPVSGSAGVY